MERTRRPNAARYVVVLLAAGLVLAAGGCGANPPAQSISVRSTESPTPQLPRRHVHVTGLAVDTHGTPVDGVTLSLRPVDDSESATAARSTDSDGELALDVAPGGYGVSCAFQAGPCRIVTPDRVVTRIQAKGAALWITMVVGLPS